MADTPKAVAPITLVAIQRGFAMGRMVEPGTSFLFRPVNKNGSRRKLPSWAVPADQVPEGGPAKRVDYDTKPKDAQEAVRRKTAELSGADLA